MKTIKLSNYGKILVDESLASKLSIDNYEEGVIFDFEDVLSISAVFSEKLFGTLYKRLGSVDYFERIKIKGTNEDLRILIRMRISNSLKKEKEL